MRIPERDVTYIVLYVYLLIYAYNNNNNNNNANLLRVGVWNRIWGWGAGGYSRVMGEKKCEFWEHI